MTLFEKVRLINKAKKIYFLWQKTCCHVFKTRFAFWNTYGLCVKKLHHFLTDVHEHFSNSLTKSAQNGIVNSRPTFRVKKICWRDIFLILKRVWFRAAKKCTSPGMPTPHGASKVQESIFPWLFAKKTKILTKCSLCERHKFRALLINIYFFFILRKCCRNYVAWFSLSKGSCW